MLKSPKTQELTDSERLFESFLEMNSIRFRRIEPAKERRPDYAVLIDDVELAFEVTEIKEDENFGTIVSTDPLITLSERILGSHIRSKISDKKGQIQWGFGHNMPSILLIYNKLDPFQMFGTEETDFIAAMYGEFTLNINKTGMFSGIFNGKNQALGKDTNTSISAVGLLYRNNNQPRVTLYENVFAQLKIPHDRLPECFEVKRIAQI